MSIKALFRRGAFALRCALIAPTDHWSGIDLGEFCGGFPWKISDGGYLEIQFGPGSSPVVIAPKERMVDYAMRALKGEVPIVGGYYSDDELAALRKLPADELRERLWGDYVERSHKPWLQRMQQLHGSPNDTVTVTRGASNPRIVKPHLGP